MAAGTSLDTLPALLTDYLLGDPRPVVHQNVPHAPSGEPSGPASGAAWQRQRCLFVLMNKLRRSAAHAPRQHKKRSYEAQPYPRSTASLVSRSRVAPCRRASLTRETNPSRMRLRPSAANPCLPYAACGPFRGRAPPGPTVLGALSRGSLAPFQPPSPPGPLVLVSLHNGEMKCRGEATIVPELSLGTSRPPPRGLFTPPPPVRGGMVSASHLALRAAPLLWAPACEPSPLCRLLP